MGQQSKISIPAYLEEPAFSKNISLPVVTKKQELPFGQLAWEDFERLCYRLGRLESQVEHCQLYGERGENQQGIDLYARKNKSDKYIVYQCKREKNFSSAKIEEAVTKFLKGNWVQKTDIFVLCTKESLKDTKRTNTFEAQSEILRRKGISFVKWDSDELSTKLKNYPEIVDDFFGREWVEAFCGREQAESLGAKLDLKPILEKYREWLHTTTAYFTVLGFDTKFSIESAWIQLQASNFKGFDKAFNADYIPDAYRRVVVTAKSGSGKSTLLQKIAHRLSNSGKQVLWVRLPQAARYYQQGKPFAEAILIDTAENSGLEISQLKRILVNPNFLFADGLDECDFTCSGIITQELLSWSAGHSDTKIIVTTRSDSHSQGSFPDWNYVELLPFGSQNVRELTRQLTQARFTDETHIEEQLVLFEQRLAANKTASLAAQNPLLTGFLVQLSIDDVELAQNRAELYESIIELLYNQSLPNREFKIDYDRSTAFRIIEITGWILQNSSDLSEHKLVEKLGQELVNELDLKLLAAKREAQQGLDFWKERRVIEYQKTGRESTITFTHLSLQEYAAGKYAASFSNQELKEWLMRVRQESKWKEVILFASGAGAVELIVTHLLALSDLDESASLELILAAEALTETQTPPLKLLDEVVKRLQLQLESPLSDRAFEATEALSLLAFKAPDAIGTVAQSLVNHTHFWTRLSAMKLLIDCGDSYVDLEILLELIDEIIIEPAQAPGIFSKIRKEKHKNWEFQNQVVCQGFQLLFKKQPSLSVANKIWNFICQGKLSIGTCQTLREILFGILPEKLENKDSQEYQGWNLLLGQLTRPDRILAEYSPEKLLRELRQREKAKLADQVFLESILRATNYSESSLLQEPRELVNLGILFKGMGWWKLAITDRDSLSERQDLEAVETVIRGTILVLNIDEEYLAADALWVLNETKSLPFCENLDTIETILNTEEDSEYRWACLKQLLEIKVNDRYCYLHHRIPEEVPVNLKWERAKNIALDSEKLLRALEHPSEGIRQNAALLLLNGAGGDEAANLVRQLLEDD